jgi:hypothetical protein
MSYATILAGLTERFETIAGLTVLDYEPTSVQTTPLLYSLIESATYNVGGQVKARHYRILHRLLLPWQDVEQAEVDVMPWVNAIPDAVYADRSLDGRLQRGTTEIVEMQAGWATVGNITYRALDFYSDTLEKV